MTSTGDRARVACMLAQRFTHYATAAKISLKVCAAQKMKFSMKDFFSKFTEEILNGKLHFLCSMPNYLPCFIHFRVNTTTIS